MSSARQLLTTVLSPLIVWFVIPAGIGLAVQHTETEKVLITQIGCHSTPKTSGEGICFVGISGPVPNPATCSQKTLLRFDTVAQAGKNAFTQLTAAYLSQKKVILVVPNDRCVDEGPTFDWYYISD